MSGPTDPRLTAKSWWILFVVTTIYIYSWLDRQIIVMLVDPIKQELGLSDFAMSLVLGPAFGLCYVAFGIPLGWAADRFDRRWVILAGVLVWSAATTSSGLASTFAMLFGARMLVAVGEAALTPAAHSLLADSFPRKRLTTAMAVYSASTKVGSSLAYAVGGLLIAAFTAGAFGGHFLEDLSPWRRVFVFVGAPGIVLAALILTIGEPRRRAVRAAGPETGGIVRFMWAERRLFIPLLLGFCSVSIPSIALQSWAPTYVGRHFGLSPGEYGPIIGLISALSALAILFKGFVVDWLYARGVKDATLRFYTWLLAIFTPVAGITFFLEDALSFLIAYGLVQVVAIPYGLYMAATVQMVTPQALRARASAVTLLAGNIASMTFGPTLVAVLTDYVFRDPAKLGWSMAIVSVCGMGGALVLLRYALRVLRPMLEASGPDSVTGRSRAAPSSRGAPCR